MVDKLWNDVKKVVERKIDIGEELVQTKAQGRKFWLVKVTEGYVRIKRERSSLPHEDVPKSDFIEIWEDLNKMEYVEGYAQSDLQEGQNWHSAVSFALVGMLPYIRWKKIGRVWKLLLVREPNSAED